MSYSRQNNKTHTKQKNRKRILLWVMVPLLILITGTVTYGAFLYNKAESVMEKSYVPVERKTDKKVDRKEEKPVDPTYDNISVLFVGIDDSNLRNYSGGSRTDALMLATFNEKQKSVKLLSIPRDSYVYIPSKGYEDKINHAYGSGGISSTIETVEELLDIPVDYYVNVNFNAFIDIVDALGGIEAEVPYALSEQDSQDRQHAINLQPGLQELNGEEALALARTRKLDSDIERGKRQQEILKSIINKALSVESITKYSDVIEAIGDNMKTDLTFSEMQSFMDYAAAGSSLTIETLSLAGQDNYINGIYYYQLDSTVLEDIKLSLRNHIEMAAENNDQITSAANNSSSS